jgi:HAD superfamily hydrolase (TIGR01549 family)
VPGLLAVLFDFHGTLFHFADGPSWVSRAAGDVGRRLPSAEAAAIWHEVTRSRDDPRLQGLWATQDLSRDDHRTATLAWLRVGGLDEGLAVAMYKRLTNPRSWSPFPETRPLLAELARRGVPVAVVSNTGWDIRATFRHHAADAFIATYVLSCERGVQKPDPEIFRIACRELQTPPERALMVGDDPRTDGGAAGLGLSVLIAPSAGHDSTRPALAKLHLLLGDQGDS